MADVRFLKSEVLIT